MHRIWWGFKYGRYCGDKHCLITKYYMIDIKNESFKISLTSASTPAPFLSPVLTVTECVACEFPILCVWRQWSFCIQLYLSFDCIFLLFLWLVFELWVKTVNFSLLYQNNRMVQIMQWMPKYCWNIFETGFGVIGKNDDISLLIKYFLTLSFDYLLCILQYEEALRNIFI